MRRQSLYFVGPGAVEVREERQPEPAPGQVLVQTLLSAISSGTELLFYRGQVPEAMQLDATIPGLPGISSYPLKYGYAAVGRVLRLGQGVAPHWEGKAVFAFHPHESLFTADPFALLSLPPGIHPEGAVFLPNMETAVTLVQDGRPMLGEQVVVFGQGIVGLLITALLSRFPLGSLVTLDCYPNRRLASENLGAQFCLDPQSPGVLEQVSSCLKEGRSALGADLAFEVSGNPEGLNQALAVTGFHGRVVIGSWYGKKRAHLDLGGGFHRSRIRLISSQVSTIEPALTGRWQKPRLLEWAWQMIQEVNPVPLISHSFPFSQASQAYALLDQSPGEAIQVILTYP
jgi:2-desacetyl-2-hydroxyethyl bacteriochlorophyllide A dehydrogenase